ncbi:fatty acyl-AMP ligase [Streptomyces sp. CJ_13]|uniref:AMP-binding protein n=1 Tax=Streptomyces sp. CJ_13 TaxID=2724943 RepID=UPI001BDD0A5E|nr:AMP-binding protein [Streptomyces sp. CJ_13]MBT1188139.1 fatty acyl-AMP ligase [Streptomyces sp. CJ_13]
MTSKDAGLWDLLLRDDAQGVLHHWEEDGFGHVPWREVVADAHGMAAALRTAGVGPGTRVAAVLTNTAHTLRGLLAVWLAGGTLASFPLPARGVSPEEYGAQLTGLTERLDPAVMLVERRLQPLVPAHLAQRIPVFDWAELYSDERIEPAPPAADETAFIQYSSGSTSLPKGCALTTQAIATQLHMIHEMTGGRPGPRSETIASWLPLSHDMGLFGTMLHAWAFDYDFVLSSPERFGMAPRTWFRDMSEFGATMTAGTNTALYLAARAQGRNPLPKALRLTVCVIGAERVDPQTLEDAYQTFRESGLDKAAFMPAYGMAEATLAVSTSPVGVLPFSRGFNTSALLEGKVVEVGPGTPDATYLVSNGPPLPGVEIRNAVPDRVSELLISSPSLATGYHGDPERSAERFRDGFLHTGDLGFVHDGEVYFVGRADDLISVGGRNVYTSGIEAAIEAMGPVRKGCSALVDLPGATGSHLVLLLEPRSARGDFELIADEAAAVARATSGVSLAECVFLERGHLPRTPSGKIQRFRCRALLGQGSGRLKPIARVRLA